MPQFTIDPEFRDKIPPLTSEEFQKLEQNILEDGEVREPLVVWKNTIIDGHHRWKIIQKHPELQGKYKVKRMEFPDKWAAIVWMCRNQLGRRNVTPQQRDYLVKEEHDALLKTHGIVDHFQGNQYLKTGLGENSQGGTKTGNNFQARKVIAQERNIKESEVRSAVEFGRGLDAAEKVSPGIKDAILSGEVKAPKSMIAEIRNVPEKQAKEVADAIMRSDVESAKQILRPVPAEKEPEEERPAYNVEDFKNDLMAAVNTFDFSLRQHMVLAHMDILQTEEGKNVAEQALLQAKDVIKKYFIHIDSIVIGGKKDG